ncbi:MAG: hypothetical protein ACRD5E_11040 [Nitrososphaeraceae archaeon]
MSTYRPPDLGEMEYRILDYFAFSESQSVYGIFKELKMEATEYGRTRSSAYKDVHKRVKRLSQLQLIEKVNEHFERGAKHYKITPYGLITNLDMAMGDDDEFILMNKENVVIQSLVLQFFEEQTIDSFHLLKEFPTRDIGDYLHECGSITRDICREFWTRFDRYKIADILPPDYVIQKYMAYLDNKSVDLNIQNEIRKYEERLEKRLKRCNTDGDSENKELARTVDFYNREYFQFHTKKYYEMHSNNPFIRDFGKDRPPFPLLYIYYDIVVLLGNRLEEKTRLLAFSLVSQLGDLINSYKIQNKEDLEENILEERRDYSLRYMLKDKKIIDLIKDIKVDFDTGYKQFMYYHKLII